MLVVRRRRGESIMIGDDVEIAILDISSSHVKIGVSAPREISVIRKEMLLAAAANRASSRAIPPEALAALIAQIPKPAAQR